MLNSDDKQFEAYLKNFRPVVPIALPRAKYRRYGSIGSLALGGSIAASIAILIMGIVVWHTRTQYRGVGRRILEPVPINRRLPLPPLTIGSANRWIKAAPSIATALDDLAFRAKNAPIPPNKKSAVAVLREEKTML